MYRPVMHAASGKVCDVTGRCWCSTVKSYGRLSSSTADWGSSRRTGTEQDALAALCHSAVLRVYFNPHGTRRHYSVVWVFPPQKSGVRLLWWYLLLWRCHGGSWEGFCRFRLPHLCICAYLTPHPLPLPILHKRPKYSVRCHITDATSRNMSDTLNRS